MNANRVWKLNTPAYGLNDAPVAFYRSLKRYLLQREVSLKLIGLKFTAPNLDPRVDTVFYREDVAVGVDSSHIGDISGCGALGVSERTRYLSGQCSAP